MPADVLKYKNDLNQDYIYLCYDMYSESKKEKLKIFKEEKSSEKNWWDEIFERSIVKPRTLEVIREIKLTHYDIELERYNKAKSLFNEKLHELKQKYSGKYVGIAEDHIEIGDNREEVKKSIIEKIGYVSMYIAKIGDDNKKVYKYKPHRKLLTK